MTPSEDFQIFIVLGKSGSGKGTQVEFLQKKFNFELISSGTLLRKRAMESDFVGKRINELITKGVLTPTPIVFHLWLHRFEELQEKGANSSSSAVVVPGFTCFCSLVIISANIPPPSRMTSISSGVFIEIIATVMFLGFPSVRPQSIDLH